MSIRLPNSLRILLIISMATAVMLTSGCAGKSGYATVSSIDYSKSKKLSSREKSATYHVVSQGETLYSIAWNYGKNFKQLAASNGIKAPYTIYPGQRIKLKSTQNRVTKKSNNTNKNKVVKKKKEESKKVPIVRQTNEKRSVGKILWQWPAKGKVIGTFSSNARFNKGIDIAGKLGEPVYSAARGKVVFAGSGLRGYGKLVIIHHDDKYLSAYAHNNKLLVKENQIIQAGQKIAEIGSTGTNQPKLHFEIRKDGKPVNPLHYLPKR
ncbi:peptidoglycan DD-metalloendopeptidase family protein [Litoribrevibacter albus]|uniref:Peptidoglycan-binding protein LysM n=1 Tax=Litoribrevibacter albus TaxID=1473156 RepID=A0AA37W844_9GAMM|nr:peptidoglycan DD-metalloendopeptidase family protein [Litoribrevibacter albus]GLQ31151.1 peptidoglycan-binding protein LysM [Litoribrevibacter albus]